MKLPTISAQSERPAKQKPHVVEAHAAVESKEAAEVGSLVRLNVEIPEMLHRQVKMKAAQEGKTIKQVVLALLAGYAK